MVVGLGGKNGGVPRQDGFMITPASEVMATLCLAEDLADLKRRCGEIIVGYTYDGARSARRPEGGQARWRRC